MLNSDSNYWQQMMRRVDGQQQEAFADFRRALENGEINIPQPKRASNILAGGTNHCPNSDQSYSKLAATVAGTTPGAPGDENQESFRVFRQVKGANVSTAAAAALKATAHSLFAANEGANGDIPRWDRVNGWIELGAAGATQYDIVIQLNNNIVSAGQRWYFHCQLGALNAALVPEELQLEAGFWHKRGGSEGYITGDNFVIAHQLFGTPGATVTEYRILARTDSGVEMLSAVLSVPNAPAVLSTDNYIKLSFHTAVGGFIEFQIYRKVGSTYHHVYTVKNSTDFQYNDVGANAGRVEGWPAVVGAAPLALAKSRTLLVGGYQGRWQVNPLQIVVPSTYDYSQTDANGQFLRISLTVPTAVARQIGIDRIWLSTTHNEWSPDKLAPFADGSYPQPSVSPTSSNLGGGDGVGDPPPPGGGGHACVAVTTPILLRESGRMRWRKLRDARTGSYLPRERRGAPYQAIAKKIGAVCEYYEIKTANGITLRCSSGHSLITDLRERTRIAAERVTEGMRLACYVRGRRTMSKVVSARLVPRVLEIGTFTLHDTGGEFRDGDGLYVAGESEAGDRGLWNHNAKANEILY